MAYLRAEFKECKDGIIYNKDGYGTVMSVKTKLLSEEAVLISQSKKASLDPPTTPRANDDEIALVSKQPKDKKHPTTKTQPEASSDDASSSKDKALALKGKGGKGNPKGKEIPKGRHHWHAPGQQWATEWTQSEWPQPSKGKGRGKGKGNTLWCDIHQRYGHSTDWCYENPNRTGGKPPSYEEL